MTPRVIVPIDGSEISAAAVPFGAAVARRAGATLVLLRAMPETLVLPGIPASVKAIARATAKKELDDAAEIVPEEVPVKKKLVVGFAVDSVLEAARGAVLIAMTTHGRSGISRAVLGSVAEKLIRLSPVPILVVRPSAKNTLRAAEAAAARLFNEVVVPLDGSSLARGAVAPFASFAGPETHVHLVTVVPPGASKAARADREHELRGMAARLEAAGTIAHRAALEASDVAGAVRSYAAENSATLIAVSSHGAGGFVEWMLGSVTDRLIRSSPIPVLVARPARK
jgi:nucleotide-binding universal stress UspA family protein